MWSLIQGSVNLSIFQPILPLFPDISLTDICQTIRYIEKIDSQCRYYSNYKWVLYTYLHRYTPRQKKLNLPLEALDRKLDTVFYSKLPLNITSYVTLTHWSSHSYCLKQIDTELTSDYFNRFVYDCQRVARTEMYQNWMKQTNIVLNKADYLQFYLVVNN